MLEVQHIDSRGPSRILADTASKQGQDVVRSLLRLHF
jgi:hypothetical protein